MSSLPYLAARQALFEMKRRGEQDFIGTKIHAQKFAHL
jgi:hypothetical protein